MIQNKFPAAVIDEVKRVISILDENYDNGKGGFAAIAENNNDLVALKQYNLDCYNDICEFADVLGNSGFVSVLYIVGTEFAIDVIMPLSIKPANITIQ